MHASSSATSAPQRCGNTNGHPQISNKPDRSIPAVLPIINTLDHELNRKLIANIVDFAAQGKYQDVIDIADQLMRSWQAVADKLAAEKHSNTGHLSQVARYRQMIERTREQMKASKEKENLIPQNPAPAKSPKGTSAGETERQIRPVTTSTGSAPALTSGNRSTMTSAQTVANQSLSFGRGRSVTVFDKPEAIG